MARMIDVIDLLSDWRDSEFQETFEAGYNFAKLAIKRRGEWVAGTLLAIVELNQNDGTFNDFDAGVRSAVDAFERGETL